MPKKLRKMLGDLDADCTKQLMALIASQSKHTLSKWCLDYAGAHMLPLYESLCPDDARPRTALNTAREYAAGNIKWADAKPIIWYEGAYQSDEPIALAAERAVGQAASLFHAPTSGHSLGFYFYGAAALAYARLGLDATTEQYNAEAEKICLDMTAALEAIAVADEPNPVNCKWFC